MSDHPVDAIKAYSAANGLPPLKPEDEAQLRSICDAPVDPDKPLSTWFMTCLRCLHEEPDCRCEAGPVFTAAEMSAGRPAR